MPVGTVGTDPDLLYNHSQEHGSDEYGQIESCETHFTFRENAHNCSRKTEASGPKIMCGYHSENTDSRHDTCQRTLVKDIDIIQLRRIRYDKYSGP